MSSRDSPQMPDDSRFDEAYYRRFYLDPATRAMSRSEFEALSRFVCHYLRYLQQPVRRVLDIGCGLGYWRDMLEVEFPRARYVGVEVSPYLRRRFGWKRGSVVDYRAERPFDLVICNDVLQYLRAAEANAAIENLNRLCRGVLLFGALTKEDWEHNCDRERTDAQGFLRGGAWYRRRLRRFFHNAGGGLYVSHRSPVVLYELEKL